jgi:hypothetical protein
MTVTDVEFLAVHALAVKKSGSAAAVAELLGLDAEVVEHALAAAIGQGRVAGARGIYMVTAAGREWLASGYPVRYAGLRADASTDAAYARFERINRELLAAFTDWQSIPSAGGRILNDHSDAEYDAKVIDRLGALHDRADRVFDALAAFEPRLARYRDRLDGASDRVLSGEFDYVSGVKVDSYHTVWFELHEDLLRLLGRSREAQ